MQLSLVNKKVAEILRRCGFEEWCDHCYINGELHKCIHNNAYLDENLFVESESAPYAELARKWLREHYNIEVEITRTKDIMGVEYRYAIYYFCEGTQVIEHYVDYAESYEVALQCGLKKACKYLLLLKKPEEWVV
jgi:hypothetical protein